ncbi:hypothetical protein ABK040_001459 [Willaertia magna]
MGNVSVEYKSTTLVISYSDTEKASAFFSRAVSAFGINQSQVSGFELSDTSTTWITSDTSTVNYTMKDLFVQSGDRITLLGKCPSAGNKTTRL